MGTRSLTISQARRIALAALGLAEARHGGRNDVRRVRSVIHRLGLLQIDYVNVLLPAHYQVLFARLGPYRLELLDELVHGRREFTEHWAHEASIVPMDAYPLLGYRRERWQVHPGALGEVMGRHEGFCDRVLDEIAERGPLCAADLSDVPGEMARLGDQWGWSRSVKRLILEAHFGHGRLAIANRRRNFVREYDLPERLIPAEHLASTPGTDEAHRELIRRAARAHGVATIADLSDYWRMSPREVRPRVEELVASGELEPVEVEGWSGDAWLWPGSRLPRQATAVSLISPFDPLVWTRDRASRLFDFDYRIEIFVPAKKRRYGYYVLPFLQGERLTGRVDLKADRKAGELLVLASYAEPWADRDEVAQGLAVELNEWASWLGLDGIRVAGKGDLATPLRAAVARL